MGAKACQTSGIGRRHTIPAESLFLLSAVAQYVGAVIAIGVFDEVPPQTVAWFRILGGAVALLGLSRRWWSGWSRHELVGIAVFGLATSGMNIFFYLAIDVIDLGKGVTLEFFGPIVVATVATRSARNGVALLFAFGGVAVLGGVEVAGNPLGLVYIMLASALWALYIVVGSRVAKVGRGVTGLGLGLLIGAVVTAPVGAPWSGPVWLSPRLLGLCLVIGVLSTAIGYGIDQYTMRLIPVRRFSLLLALLPVTASLIGWVALGQRPSTIDALGICLVLIGVAAQEREELHPERGQNV